MLKKTAQGFTLIELIVVIAIIAIFVAVVYLVINPSEYQKRGRDATRITDAANLEKTFNSGKIPTTMPIDPLNDSTYNYKYASDSSGWEFDVVLESQQFAGKAATDGGDCDTQYEVGTNLTLQGC